MQITVNNNFQEVSANLNIVSLMENLFPNGNTRGLAIAINQEVISKENWPSHIIKENDKVMIIRATQGG